MNSVEKGCCKILKLRIFWVLFTAAVFFGLLDKRCILKCFIFSLVFLGLVYSLATSVNTILHYYYIVFNFCSMNSVSGGIF